MNYEIIIQKFSHELPHFSDGRIDYSISKEAPVLNCFVVCEGEYLLLKRSDKVNAYRGKWTSIGGYLDEPRPLQEKVLEELREELNIGPDNIETIVAGEPYLFRDEEIDKTWHIFPVLAKLKNKPEIKLDWEHTEFRWVKEDEIKNYDTVPRLLDVLAHIK